MALINKMAPEPVSASVLQSDTGASSNLDDLVTDNTPEEVLEEEVVEEQPEPVVTPEPPAVTLEPVVMPEPTPEPATEPTGLSAADYEVWESLKDRIFDTACTEVKIIAQDPSEDAPYKCLVVIETVTYEDPSVSFTSREQFERILEAFILPATRMDWVNKDNLPPIVDGTLALTDEYEGTTDTVRGRVQLRFPPVTYGPSLDIMKIPSDAYDLGDLVGNGTLPEGIALFLASAWHAKFNIVFSGMPGSGKTTLLNAVTMSTNPMDNSSTISGELVAVAQEVDELPLTHLSTLKLFTWQNTAHQQDTVNDGSMSSILNSIKRSRPSRLITGECRGPEMYEHLQASTIFDGCMTTVHANNSQQAMDNMVTMSAANADSPGVAGCQALVGTGVDIIVQLGIHKHKRIVTEVLEVSQGTNSQGMLQRNLLWEYAYENGTPEAPAWKKGEAGPGRGLQRKLALAGQADFFKAS